MKATKKIVSTALASALIISAGSTAFAAVPKQSFILGEEAYSNDYLETPAGGEHLIDLVNAIKNDVNGDVLFKLSEETLFDVENGVVVDNSVLPEVTYYKADGTTTKYAAGDGEEIVASDMNITAATAINEGSFTVTFAEAPTDSLNGKTLTLTNGDVTATAAFVSLNGNVATFDIADTTNMTSGNYALAASWTQITAGVTVEFVAGASLEMISKIDGEIKDTVTVTPSGAQQPVDIELALIDFPENVEATIEYTATWGEIPEESLTNGQVSKVTYYPEADAESRTTVITATVTSAKNTVTGQVLEDYKNVSKSIELKLIPAGSETGDGKVYQVTGGLADQADRIYINLNQDLTEEAEELILNHPEYFNVYDNATSVGTAANKIDVAEVKKKDADTLVLILQRGDAQFPLTDNATHFVEVKGNSGQIYFSGTSTLMLEDDTLIKMNAVQTQRDDETLKYNQLKIIFSEAVNDMVGNDYSVTNLANWTINGINLEKDLPSADGNNVDVEVVSTNKETTERETVILTFKDVKDIQAFLVPEENRLQVRNIGDWASINHTNNVVSTLSTTYMGIDEPEAGLDWTMDSPEQFVVDFGSYVTGVDKDTFQIIIPKSDENDPYGVGAYETITPSRFIDIDGNETANANATDKFTVTEIEAGRKYAIEMDEDWTVYYDTQGTGNGTNYHMNLVNPIRLQAKDVYDAIGNPLKDSGASSVIKTASADLTLNKDNTSAKILDFTQLTSVKGKNEDGTIGKESIENIETAITAADAGAVYLSFSEPMQFADQQGTAIVPGLTQSQQQNAADLKGTFEYVQLKDADGNDVLQNVTIEGRIVESGAPATREGINGEESARDFAIVVEPVEELADGTWELTIRDFTDDVGNGMDTYTEEITITSETGTVTPDDLAVVAIDAHHDLDAWKVADSTVDLNEFADTDDDIIHIVFNEEMDFVSDSAVNRETNYRLDGKQLPQTGVQIRKGIKGNGDGLSDSAKAVTIILPDGTLDNKDEPHILSIINVKNKAKDDMVNVRLQVPYEIMHSMNVAKGADLTEDTANFKTALANDAAEIINVPNTIATVGDGTTVFELDRIADIIEAGPLTIAGDVVINTLEEGTIDLGDVANQITITGDLTINAKNATVNNFADVQGTTTITDVSNATFNNYGDLANLVMNDTDKGTRINNQGTITVLEIASNVPSIDLSGNAPVTLNDNRTGDNKTFAPTYTTAINGNNLVVTFNGDVEAGFDVEYDSGAGFTAANVVKTTENLGTVNEKDIYKSTIDISAATKVDLKFTSKLDATVTTVVYGVYAK